MKNELYLVTYDDFKGDNGSSILCGGVFTDRKKATEIADSLPFGEVNELTLDEQTNIYLGGYVEWPRT